VIQEFISQECGKGKVDEHTFAVTMKKLVTMQEKEAEFAVVDKGEHMLCQGFSHLLVPPACWSKMTEKQKQSALRKIHTVGPKNLVQIVLQKSQVLWKTREILTNANLSKLDSIGYHVMSWLLLRPKQ
jgi:hypothetical protein